MIFTENLLKILCEKDPHISFLLNTHGQYMKEERIDFYDSLTRINYTFCFDYNNPKLRFFIAGSADFSKSERVRKRQIEQNLLPLLISSIKEDPTFRIKFILKECSIDDYNLSNENLDYYSLNYFLQDELYEIDHYPLVFSFIFFGFCLGIFTLYVTFTRLSSMTLFIVAAIVIILTAFIFTFLIYFFQSFFIATKQYLQMRKIKKLERKNTHDLY